jgi:hypothetical protein
MATNFYVAHNYMLQYTLHPNSEREFVAKDSEGFLIIHPLPKADGDPSCLENLSIDPSERDKSKMVSRYAEMRVTIDGSVFCPILVDGTQNNPEYYLQIVEYRIRKWTTLCRDHKYPDGIILRLRNTTQANKQSVTNNGTTRRKSKKQGWSRDV